MTATTATVATCPTWCNGRDHIYDRGPKTHPDDAGVSHLSEDVDSWSPADEHNEEDVRIYIDGFRHDNESGEDYPDTIRADNVSPGFMGAVQLHVPDARRLAWALLAACDLAEGTTASRAVSTAIVAFVHDEAARQGIELSIPDPPTVDELKAAADALGMKPSDIVRKAEDARIG